MAVEMATVVGAAVAPASISNKNPAVCLPTQHCTAMETTVAPVRAVATMCTQLSSAMMSILTMDPIVKCTWTRFTSAFASLPSTPPLHVHCLMLTSKKCKQLHHML